MSAKPSIKVVSMKDVEGFYVEVDDLYYPAWFPTRDEAESYAEDCRTGEKDPYVPGEFYL